MRFKYCPQCGEKLISKEIGDEGQIPFCETCRRPFWDMFTTSIICAVINEYNEIALIRKSYVSKTKYVCIAGIMKPNEAAEETAVREIKEEIGLDVETLEYIRSLKSVIESEITFNLRHWVYMMLLQRLGRVRML